jgi:hypothetical protein
VTIIKLKIKQLFDLKLEFGKDEKKKKKKKKKFDLIQK